MKIRKDSFIVTVTTLVSIMSIGGCQDFKDTNECTLPCWEGIVPGVTTENEAKKLITEKYHMTEELLVDTSINWSARDYHANVRFHNDTVSGIRIWFDRQMLTVGDIISQYGEPETVEIEPPEWGSGCGVRLQYEQRGIEVTRLSEHATSGIIEASQYVYALNLFRSDPSNSMMVGNPRVIVEEWRGYGIYCTVSDY